jgi:hypothetical protein
VKIAAQLLPAKVEADIQHSHVVYLPQHLSPEEIERKYGTKTIEHAPTEKDQSDADAE